MKFHLITLTLTVVLFSGLHAQNFDWPSSGKVRVTESVEKKGNTAKMSYYLTINSTDDLRLIRFSDLKFLSINQEKVGPELEAKLAPIIESLNNMPSFVVNAKGELVDIAGLTEKISPGCWSPEVGF